MDHLSNYQRSDLQIFAKCQDYAHSDAKSNLLIKRIQAVAQTALLKLLIVLRGFLGARGASFLRSGH
jgi:hypothetical protein